MIIRDICDINKNSLKPKESYDEYKYLDTSNLTKNRISEYQIFDDKKLLPSRAKRKIQNNDILISTVRPAQCHYGYFDEVRENIIASTGFTILSPYKTVVNPKYLYYFLTQEKITNYFQMIAESAVSSYPSITSDIIGNMSIELPSISAQNEIVRKIEIFDERIDNNFSLYESLEKYTQLLMYKWFVDFNFSTKNGHPYKDSGGKIVEKGGLLMPEGWTLKRIDEITSKHTDSIDVSQYPDKLFKYYNIPTFDDTSLYEETYGSEIGSNKYLITDKSILVSKLNPWFKRIAYPYDIKEGIASTEFVVLEPLIDNTREFLYLLFNTHDFINYCTKAATGTSNSHKRVNPDHVVKYSIPYNEEVVIRFNKIIKPIVERMAAILIENQAMSESRDLIMKKLVQ